MKKFTKKEIREVVEDMVKHMTKYTSEILLDNMENCTSKTCELEDKNLSRYLDNVMIPISTAYQMSIYTMGNVLCKLLCDDEKDDEASDKSNEIVLAEGESLTVKKDKCKIEISDNGVMVSNLE